MTSRTLCSWMSMQPVDLTYQSLGPEKKIKILLAVVLILERAELYANKL